MAVKTLKITINNHEYELQHPGLRWYTQHSDRCMTGSGIPNQEKYLDGVLEHVVIKAPEEVLGEKNKLSLDSFDDYPEDFEELVAAIERFLKGR